MLTYFNALLSGAADPFIPHLLPISASVLAGISVGSGIILEAPKYSARVHDVAVWLVISGVAVESVCTVSLFVFDEAISNAQLSKIIELEKKLAPRDLSNDQLSRIVAATAEFPNTPYDVAVDENSEPRHLLSKILPALGLAHWKRKPWGGPGGGLYIYIDGIPIAFRPLNGVSIEYDSSREQEFGAAAKALASALTKEEIPTEVSTNAVTKEQIRLLVGTKP